MGLATHLGRLERDDVEDGAMGREEEVELSDQVRLPQLRIQVRAVEPVVVVVEEKRVSALRISY